VSPSLSEASTAAALTIHDVIEARPLEKAQKEADELHQQQHAQLHPSPSLSGSNANESNGILEIEAAVKEAEAEAEEEYEEEAVLNDDDRELDRVFDVRFRLSPLYLPQIAHRFHDDRSSQPYTASSSTLTEPEVQLMLPCVPCLFSSSFTRCIFHFIPS
jgi:hypothetical protein